MFSWFMTSRVRPPLQGEGRHPVRLPRARVAVGQGVAALDEDAVPEALREVEHAARALVRHQGPVAGERPAVRPAARGTRARGGAPGREQRGRAPQGAHPGGERDPPVGAPRAVEPEVRSSIPSPNVAKEQAVAPAGPAPAAGLDREWGRRAQCRRSAAPNLTP